LRIQSHSRRAARCSLTPLFSSQGLFTALAYLLGAATSLGSGYLGMKVGVFANIRTAVQARLGMRPAFSAAFRGGAAIGFTIAGLGVASLFAVLCLSGAFFKADWRGWTTSVAGFGLGASSVALFARVGGGIFTKAADVGADLSGKIEQDIPEVRDATRRRASVASGV